MLDLQVLKENPELAKSIKIEFTGQDFLTIADEYAKREVEAKAKELSKTQEEYLTPEEMAKTLRISQVTLWSWDKKGITHPLRIGNMKRYRRSDVEKFLTQE